MKCRTFLGEPKLRMLMSGTRYIHFRYRKYVHCLMNLVANVFQREILHDTVNTRVLRKMLKGSDKCMLIMRKNMKSSSVDSMTSCRELI